MKRNEWVEHQFRVALTYGYGYVPRIVQSTKDFIEALPDADRKFIERAFGPYDFIEDATRDDLKYYASGRLEEIEERFMSQRGLGQWR